MLAEFLITSLIVVIAPGTGVLYTVSIGLSRGALASVVAAAGCTFGIVPHLAAAILGLAAVLQTSPIIFQSFKFLGVIYLLYIAWSILKERGAMDVSLESEQKPLKNVALTGFLINILNPKLSIFFLAFLPQFVPADNTAPFFRISVLSLLFMAMTFIVFICYGFFAAKVSQRVISQPLVMTWIRRCFSAAFVALGIKLIMATRN